jgi:glutaminyl-peptide cyclotransferase
MLFASSLLSLASLLAFGSAYQDISDESLKNLPGPGNDFNIKNGAILAPILIPRVSGTEGNVAVRQHFIDFFHKELPEWRIELHNSTS